MRKIKPHKYAKLIVLAVLGLMILIVGLSLGMERGMTTDLRKVFNEESDAISSHITGLGVQGDRNTYFQCLNDEDDYFFSKKICQNFTNYTYSFRPTFPDKIQAYPSNAARLSELLSARGWSPDRSEDGDDILIKINPYLEQNDGVGGSAPFHKNVGPIRCNLKIDFNDTMSMTGPGSLNVNTFSCAKNITYPAIHFRKYTY